MIFLKQFSVQNVRRYNHAHKLFYKHIVVPRLLTIVLDLDKNYMYLDETRSRKNLIKTIPNPKNIILRIQIKNSIFSWKDQLDAIQVSLVIL